MAITSANDISVVLSGGTTNTNPNNSLGGDPATAPVKDGVLNNLFDDISPEEAETGHEDYRCFYYFNDGETSLYNIKLFISEDFVEGATLEVGVESRDETQRIQLSGAIITEGSMTLSYGSSTFVSEYSSELGTWSTNLRNQLTSIPGLEDVTVTAQEAGAGVVIFDVSFGGKSGKRNHDKIQVVSNDFTPQVEINITTPQQGAPVNTIAPDIGLETTPPGGVGFYVPSEQSPILLPVLNPEEGFPIWVKRVVEVDTASVADDGFRLRLVAQSLI